MHGTTFSTTKRSGRAIDGNKTARGRAKELRHRSRSVAQAIKNAIDERRTQASKLRSKAIALEEEGFAAVAETKRERARSAEQEAEKLEAKLKGGTAQ